VTKEEEDTTLVPTLQVVSATTKSPKQMQLTMLMNMVKGPQATVTELQHDQADKRHPDRRTTLSTPRNPPAGDVVRQDM